MSFRSGRRMLDWLDAQIGEEMRSCSGVQVGDGSEVYLSREDSHLFRWCLNSKFVSVGSPFSD